MCLEPLKYYQCVDGSIVCCYIVDTSQEIIAQCVDVVTNITRSYYIDGTFVGQSKHIADDYKIVREYKLK